jgi:hypothetical protein
MVNIPMVSPSETTTLLGPNKAHLGKPTWPPSGTAMVTDVHTSELFFEPSCSDEEEDSTKKESISARQFRGEASLLQRRFCGFAKSGKLRDPEASERFAGGSEKFGFPSNSSQPLPGARASQAIARAGPMKGRLASYMCSALEY